MSFWAKFFQDIEVSAQVRFMHPRSECIEKFVNALKKSNLKIPVHLDLVDTEISSDLDRSGKPTLFGSASIFQAMIAQSENEALSLTGTISVAPFFRLFFQVFLILGELGSFIVFGVSVWKWASIFFLGHRSELDFLEVASAGFAACVMFIAFVKLLAILNYLSTREQKAKIIAAFESLES